MMIDNEELRQCGLCYQFTLTRNPHSEAGKPERLLEVGAEWECIPCNVKSRHGWTEKYHKAQAVIEELKSQLETLQQKALCHAGKDGDCTWPECPQLKDNEPIVSGRHCQLDVVSE